MDNAEEIMQSLEEFSKMKPKDIPHELDDYLGYVAKTGDPVFKWSIIKCLFREKLVNVITDFYESTLTIELPPCPNVDSFNYERMKANLLEKLDSFHGAPFTVQRISELLTNPRKEYNRADKFMRAIEKNILVVSTREPGRFAEGESESDPSFNGIPDANDSVVDPAFPCNDLADPDSSSHTYEVNAENIEPAYSVNVDAVAESTGVSNITETPGQEDVFAGGPAAREHEENVEIPSTSTETKYNDESNENKENGSVICSTISTPSQEPEVQQVNIVEPITETPSDRSANTPPNPELNVEQETLIEATLETPVPSTSEATSVESSEEPVPCTFSNTPMNDLPPEQDVEASSSQVSESGKEVLAAQDVVLPTASQELIESTIEVLPLSEEPHEAIPVETSEKEVSELRCTEPSGFEDDRPIECDTSNISQEVEVSAVEPIANEEVTKEPASIDTSGDVPISDENEVTSCADSANEVSSDGSGDVARDTSVIHTTSTDEPMDVDDCQTSSSEQTLQP